MRRLRYTAAARADLAEIAAYIAEQSDSRAVAEAFADRLRQKCAQLAMLPGTLGTARPELGHELRSTPFQAYVIFFRYEEDAVTIVDVLHGQRDIAG